MVEHPYGGYGKCRLGVRRLTRTKLATSSPERQREDVLTAAASVRGLIIGWGDDGEVSGATDPMTRPKPARGFTMRGVRTTGWWPQPWTGSAATSRTA